VAVSLGSASDFIIASQKAILHRTKLAVSIRKESKVSIK
jgi:hypothetical protein